MNNFWENNFVQTAANYSVVVLSLIVFLSIFELVTKYNNMEQIKNGNLAVALATGGKIFGIANIFRYSIQHNESLASTLLWGIYGFILLLIGYFIFEFLTPKFNIDEEIEKGNTAVGFIAMIISIGLSFVIGANIGS
ncbi:DUF350 domain-containing protein [Calidifontibacillus erzurumensis]|uniref:DUF350 domain-containing protein n=1 Tax=Calidifontibacillus erzurumensis TaxID=2741433 RepID=A0A8J8GCY6_9BACI|nr:DUF350 domain-containing protein [Calidifontibacillus erzurumensis]NSL51544.1 DUF350 domain-containing protein [Calidifontibacillus erzurumensis]